MLLVLQVLQMRWSNEMWRLMAMAPVAMALTMMAAMAMSNEQ